MIMSILHGYSHNFKNNDKAVATDAETVKDTVNNAVTNVGTAAVSIRAGQLVAQNIHTSPGYKAFLTGTTVVGVQVGGILREYLGTDQEVEAAGDAFFLGVMAHSEYAPACAILPHPPSQPCQHTTAR